MSSKTAASSSSARCTAHSAFTRSSRTTTAARPDEHRIIEHQQLRVEDRRQVGALELGDASADLLELLARSLTRALERGQLTGDAIERDRKPDDLRALNRDQGRTDGHTRRHPNAF